MWFLFAMALVTVLAYLPAHVASGRARRSFVGIATAMLAVTRLVRSLLLMDGFALERAAFDAQGWRWVMSKGQSLTGTGDLGALSGSEG